MPRAPKAGRRSDERGSQGSYQDPSMFKGGGAGVRGRSPQPLGAAGALREP